MKTLIFPISAFSLTMALLSAGETASNPDRLVNTVTVAGRGSGAGTLKERNNLRYMSFVNGYPLILAYSSSGDGINMYSIDGTVQKNLIKIGDDDILYRMVSSHRTGRILIGIMNYDDRDSSYMGVYSLNKHDWEWRTYKVKDLYWGAFSENDQFVWAARENYVYRIDANSGKVIEKDPSIMHAYPQGHNRAIGAMISQSGKYLIMWHRYVPRGWLYFLFGKANPLVSVYDLENKKVVSTIRKPDSDICWASFMPDEKHVAMTCFDNVVRIWSLEENKFIREDIESGETYVTAPAGKDLLAIAGRVKNKEYRVQIWQWPDFQLLRDITPGSGYWECDAQPCAFSSDGNYFAIEVQGKLRLYDTNTWQELWAQPTYMEN